MLVPGNTRTRTFLYWPLQIELPRPISAALVPRHVAHNSYHQEIKQSLEEGTSFAARALFLVRGVIDESLLTLLVPLLPSQNNGLCQRLLSAKNKCYSCFLCGQYNGYNPMDGPWLQPPPLLVLFVRLNVVNCALKNVIRESQVIFDPLLNKGCWGKAKPSV